MRRVLGQGWSRFLGPWNFQAHLPVVSCCARGRALSALLNLPLRLAPIVYTGGPRQNPPASGPVLWQTHRQPERFRGQLAMRILIVEDEPDLLRALTQALREEGYAVD